MLFLEFRQLNLPIPDNSIDPNCRPPFNLFGGTGIYTFFYTKGSAKKTIELALFLILLPAVLVLIVTLSGLLLVCTKMIIC